MARIRWCAVLVAFYANIQIYYSETKHTPSFPRFNVEVVPKSFTCSKSKPFPIQWANVYQTEVTIAWCNSLTIPSNIQFGLGVVCKNIDIVTLMYLMKLKKCADSRESFHVTRSINFVSLNQNFNDSMPSIIKKQRSCICYCHKF